MAINFTPQTNLVLLAGVPLTTAQEHTYDFSNAAQQATFFRKFQLSTYAFDHFTYQRERSAIRVPLVYDACCSCNYVMYQNSNYTNKWFYAFVTQINYVNPNMSELIIETDVMQTWMFDYQILPSFIEREHVENDAKWLHTVPEGLEFGPQLYEEWGELDLNQMVVMLALAIGNVSTTPGGMLEGVYTGVQYSYFRTTTSGISKLNEIIQTISQAGLADDIVGLWMVPEVFYTKKDEGWGLTLLDMVGLTTQGEGYTPRNNKLFSWPYYYLTVDNGNGASVNWLIENFANPRQIRMACATMINMEPSAWCYPLGYNGEDYCWLQGLGLSNFPMCTWNNNIYANWLARNRYSLGFQNLSMGINLAEGAAEFITTLNPARLASAATDTLGTLAQRKDKSMFPYQLQGQPSSDCLNVKWERVGFHIHLAKIKAEYAKILDDFFDVYGYKVARVGVPDTKSRTRWNYIKTQHINIKPQNSGMPTEHLISIKSIYNAGITFWHGDYLGDYSQLNPCVNGNIYPDYPPAPSFQVPEVVDPLPDPGEEWSYPIDGWETHVTSEYGWRTDPFTGETKFHNGIDIGFPEGTPIRAIHKGVVTFRGTSAARGYYIDVEATGTAFVYRYQHLSRYNVEVGESVNIGDTLGDVGQTGAATGPHLHLEILADGNTYNPRSFLGPSPSGGV